MRLRKPFLGRWRKDIGSLRPVRPSGGSGKPVQAVGWSEGNSGCLGEEPVPAPPEGLYLANLIKQVAVALSPLWSP